MKYPLHAAGLLGNWQLVEGIKEGFCCAAADYRDTLRYVAMQPNTAGGQGFEGRCCSVAGGLLVPVKVCEVVPPPLPSTPAPRSPSCADYAGPTPVQGLFVQQLAKRHLLKAYMNLITAFTRLHNFMQLRVMYRPTCSDM